MSSGRGRRSASASVWPIRGSESLARFSSLCSLGGLRRRKVRDYNQGFFAGVVLDLEDDDQFGPTRAKIRRTPELGALAVHRTPSL